MEKKIIVMSYPGLGTQKMTRKLVMDIDSGLWIASGRCAHEMMPDMIEQIPESANERNNLWKKIKKNRLNGRNFTVYSSKKDILACVKAMREGGGRVLFKMPDEMPGETPVKIIQ